jgi:hypothetical protein
MIEHTWQEVVFEPLHKYACETCGGGGGNDPSGDRGSDPNCQDCEGSGDRRTCVVCGHHKANIRRMDSNLVSGWYHAKCAS